MEKSEYRLQILEKMKEYEKKGLFDQDLENDVQMKLILKEKRFLVKSNHLSRIRSLFHILKNVLKKDKLLSILMKESKT